jgi:hypothetical protein
MSRFWDTFAAEMLSTIADYPIRQVYVTPDGMDFLPNIKEIQNKLFFEPPRSWGPFWPTSYSEAQSIISPHDLCEELERLTGYTVNKKYYNSVIAKAYESERSWTNPTQSDEAIMRRRCHTFIKYQDAWLLKEQIQCLQCFLQVYYEDPETFEQHLPWVDTLHDPPVPHKVAFPENFNDGDFAADDDDFVMLEEEVNNAPCVTDNDTCTSRSLIDLERH